MPATALAFLAAACSQDKDPSAGERNVSAGGASAPAPVADATQDRTTSLTGCTLTRSVPEEGGFFEHECPGEGGYRLRHVESDLRENIVILSPGGGEHSLGLPALASGAFSSIGDTVEWRGETKADTFAPRALILRQSVMEDPDPAVPEVSYLIVAKLGAQPCVVARIPPGPAQSESARQAADQTGNCLAPSA